MQYMCLQDHSAMTLNRKYIGIREGKNVERRGDILYYHDEPLHYVTSHLAHKYYVRNDDHQGLKRHSLQSQIFELCKAHNAPGDRWSDRLWQTPAMQVYRRSNNDERWLWNQRFYDASIVELEWILSYLIKP